MAASDPHPGSNPHPPGLPAGLSAPALRERLDEEIARAERQGTPLCCLLVAIENLDELARRHGRELVEHTLDYVEGILQRELRRFDRIGRPSDGELLLLLPGADGPRGEIVARRVLERLRTVKVEADGVRRPLRISVGLASWRADLGGDDLLAQMRSAASTAQNGDSSPALQQPGPS